MIVLVVITLVILLVSLMYFFIKHNTQVIDDLIVIDQIEILSTSDLVSPLSSGMLEYLLLDTLLQSSNKNVITANEFIFLHGSEKNLIGGDLKKPELRIKIISEYNGTKYNITTYTTPAFGKSRKYSYEFFDISTLLTEKIIEITKMILSEVGVHEIKVTTFTESWDAFKHFYQAEKAWEKLEIEEAEVHLGAALNYDPDFVLAKLRLAHALNTFDRPSEALELIHKIKPHLGKLSQIDSLRAEALYAGLNGDWREEIKMLRKINELFPSRKESAFEVAEAYYLKICNVTEAIPYYEKALHIDNNYALAYNHLAYCYSHLGDHKKAIHYFNKYVEIDSTANAFDSLGDGYMASGELEKAESAKKQGIRFDPGRYYYLYLQLGYIQIKQGKLKEAEKNIQISIDKSEGNEDKARGYFAMAFIHYIRQDYDSAKKYCLKGLELHDSENIVTRIHDLHWLLGLLYLKLNQLEKAQNELNQMKKIVDEHAINAINYRRDIYKYKLHLEACFAAKDDNSEGIRNCINELDKIKDKVKDHFSPFDLAYFYTSYGELLMGNTINELDEAQGLLENALKYNSNYAMAHYYLWLLFHKKGDEVKAQEHQIKFKELWKDSDPDIKEIYDIL